MADLQRRQELIERLIAAAREREGASASWERALADLREAAVPRGVVAAEAQRAKLDTKILAEILRKLG